MSRWLTFISSSIQNKILASKGSYKKIAKRTVSVKKVMYVMFFTNQSPAIQITVPKITFVKVFKSKILRKLKNFFANLVPASVLSSARLLHDKASSHKVVIVRENMKQEKIVELPHPRYLPDLGLFLLLRFKNHLAGKKCQTCRILGSAISQRLNSIHVPSKYLKHGYKIRIKDLKFVYITEWIIF